MTPVPDRAKAIEAMARGMLNETRGRLAKWDIPTWEEMSASRQDAYRADARAALAALDVEGLVLTDTDAKNETIRKLDRLVCEFCKAVGEPVPVDAIAIARVLRGLSAADRREAERLRGLLAEAVPWLDHEPDGGRELARRIEAALSTVPVEEED